ncbi:hypothetical protein QBC38DRAFT_482415 [Podospora fimiseda]|uniref:Erythromycin biosynthesis protein CIII-like C-terminal domain-containing protein n=1 Tax=Podospora fimiseda TaxID=252190 RepID=A0AAN7BLW5_9PEZI|nr:hypothetical protein QBC38DRAFT_482415 [Podospora fimiseda]
MKKILITTNWEVGQSNVCLAVAHALVQADPTAQVHFASQEPIREAFKITADHAKQQFPSSKPIIFHPIAGKSMVDALLHAEPTIQLFEATSRPPTFLNIINIISKIMTTLLPWTAEDFCQSYNSLVEIINTVQPDLVVTDCLFSPGLTVCSHLNLKHVVISPNTLKDFCVSSQPRFQFFWKYPSMGSAFPCPVPWNLIPLNIFFVFLSIYYFITDARFYKTIKEISELTGGVKVVGMQHLTAPITKPENAEKRTKVLVGCSREVDFPLEFIPDHIIPCGSIVRAVKPVLEVDPELDAWLKKGPTVFLALGSHIELTEKEALEVAGAFRFLFDAVDAKAVDEIGGVQGKLQVYWKLQKREVDGEYGWDKGSKIWKVLAREMDSDRVRIIKWVKPEPAAVLQTGSVVCVANHGGANSYYDAITAGVPQVSLPVWFDCYDFASRVEVLGVGKWGNRRAMPRSSTQELGAALVNVVLEQNLEYKVKASKLAKLCAKAPGAEVAAAAILSEYRRTGMQI